jgi:hypothetical protein
MAKRMGLWIDHSKAVIVSIDCRAQILDVPSGLSRRSTFRGGQRSRGPFSAQYQPGDDQLDRQFTEHLNKFYGNVIAFIRLADSVFIFGPGEAKLELQKRLAHEKLSAKITAIETTDKMTDRQIFAKVRNYFKKIPAPMGHQ